MYERYGAPPYTFMHSYIQTSAHQKKKKLKMNIMQIEGKKRKFEGKKWKTNQRMRMKKRMKNLMRLFYVTGC